jgi:hypothetical protein
VGILEGRRDGVRQRARIPNRVHFVFGLGEREEPFHLVHYVALESCRRVLAPDEIHLHYRHLPHGVYWDLIRPRLTLNRVDLVEEVLRGPRDERRVPAAYRYAHHADFVRLDALIRDGGIYADIDTLFVRPYLPRLLEKPFVIGAEPPVRDERTGASRPSLCNAVLMAEPGSEYALTWRREMGAALNGTWSNHSGFLAWELSQRMPAAVHVEPSRSFFRFPATRDGLAALLQRDQADLDGVFSIHLWAHLWWDSGRRDFSPVHAAMLTPDHVREVDTTYNVLARPFLPDLAGW